MLRGVWLKCECVTGEIRGGSGDVWRHTNVLCAEVAQFCLSFSCACHNFCQKTVNFFANLSKLGVAQSVSHFWEKGSSAKCDRV